MANRLGCTVLAWDLPQISDLLSVRVGVNSEITGNKAGKMMDRSKMRSKSKSECHRLIDSFMKVPSSVAGVCWCPSPAGLHRAG